MPRARTFTSSSTPANGYPQDEPWFQSFAGTAFSWLDSTQTNAAPNPVFAVVGDAPKVSLEASTAPRSPSGAGRLLHRNRGLSSGGSVPKELLR